MSASKFTALVVDQDWSDRNRTAQALLAEGIVCEQTADGTDALDRARGGHFDLVVTELTLPERHGHALCCDLFGLKDPPHVVVLTNVTEPRLVRDLMKRGVGDVCFKSADMASFAAKVRVQLDRRQESRAAALLAATEPTADEVDSSDRIAPIIDVPEEARRLAAECSQIVPLPQLLSRLVEYFQMPVDEIPLVHLATDISVDSRATAELLRLTNSSSVGLTRTITRVSEAVTLLGPLEAIRLILASAMVRSQSDALAAWSEPLRYWYCQRSMINANAAAVFGQRCEGLSRDTGFVLGLMQDVGMLVLGTAYPSDYEQIVTRAQDGGPVSLVDLEREEFGMSHAEVSAALLLRWKLPRLLIHPVCVHHGSWDVAVAGHAELRYLRAMQIGEALSDLADCEDPQRTQSLQQLLDTYGAARSDQCRACITEVMACAADSCELYSLPVPDMSVLTQRLEHATLVLAGR